jgi:tetratricopeptide (TPR) repeat protein
MAFQLQMLTRPARLWRPRWRALVAGALTPMIVGMSALPSLAGDPFRPNNPHNIGEASEATFKALFYEGNYGQAQVLVRQAIAAEPDEPMNYAIAAALGYLNRESEDLSRYAQRTQDAAEGLKATDPLRGHLYTAVGLFLEGAHVLQSQGIARGTPTALRMLQRVFRELDAAERIDRNDPELSLLKGFMDLLLAVNLPFANPDQAIARLQNGHPAYLSHRGVAIGFRDLGRYSEALAAVNQALELAPDNPDLMYLKAQILYLNQQPRDSVPFYEAALSYADQLPPATVRQIQFETCNAKGLEPADCGI